MHHNEVLVVINTGQDHLLHSFCAILSILEILTKRICFSTLPTELEDL